ncbi:MAG: hypothetical protein HS111_28700 [Kofleriaceae bacterium]|nr:hypothetical protein [Kofleriaceae bacterium]
MLDCSTSTGRGVAPSKARTISGSVAGSAVAAGVPGVLLTGTVQLAPGQVQLANVHRSVAVASLTSPSIIAPAWLRTGWSVTGGWLSIIRLTTHELRRRAARAVGHVVSRRRRRPRRRSHAPAPRRAATAVMG